METNKISRLSNKVCPEGMSIEEWQIALRREQAALSSFTVEHLDDNRIGVITSYYQAVVVTRLPLEEFVVTATSAHA